jgi:hypothetical protein
VFFEGGSYLMAMLSAFERGDSDKGKAVGSDAVKSFSSASGLYKSVAGKMSQIADDKLASVNVEIAAAIAQTSPSVALFSKIAQTAQGKNAPTNLIVICGDESEQMSSSTAQFLEIKKDQEKHYAALLSTWTRVLFIGRTVSAFFAAAGGQN